jgi:histidyl-tRNA synthetase
VSDLRAAGLVTEYSLTPMKSDKQFKRAMELKAAYTVRLERDPSGGVVAKTKNLKTREERASTPGEVAASLQKA